VNDEIDVTQGQIRVNEIWVVRSSRTFLVIEADLRSKYPEGYDWSEDGLHTVHLFANQRTMFRGPGELPTAIRLPERTRGWAVLVDAVRYTVQVAAWKPAGPGRTLFCDPLPARPDGEGPADGD
jgi:hypothetical protein